MRVVTNYDYPDKGTANNRIYSAEILLDAFNEESFKELCSTKGVPVCSTYDGTLIGMATASLDKTRVTIDAEIFNTHYIDLLKQDYETLGLLLAGEGKVKYKENGNAVVESIRFTQVVLTNCPGVPFFTEIFRNTCIEEST